MECVEVPAKMTDIDSMSVVTAAAADDDDVEVAQPLHLQRLERALRLDTFLDQFDAIFADNLSDGDDDDTTDTDDASVVDSNCRKLDGIVATKQDFRSDKAMLYNFTRVKRGRKWLKNLLLSDSSDEDQEISEDDLKQMLKIHLLNRKHQAKFKTDKDLKQYQYYSVGLLSTYDRFPDHQKAIIGNTRKAKEKKLEKKIKAKLKRIKKKEKKRQDIQDSILHQSEFTDDLQLANLLASLCEEGGPAYGGVDGRSLSTPKSRRKSAAVTEASLANKRRKLWVTLSKKEIPKAQKHLVAVRKEIVTNCKKMAQACQKEIRKAAIQFQKSLKEAPGRARRLTREMLLYWKRYEKVEKEMRKRAEKEAQEQLKMDIELREAKRQQRKLNFLITQTELYAHFMSRKLNRVGGQDAIQERILNQLIDEQPLPRALDDDYDGEETKAQALRNARFAYESQQSKAKVFDFGVPLPVKRHQDGFGDDFRLTDPSISTEQDRPQPRIFKGKLKVYQLKGMNWLANLYDQGINGILADEMGLGKTVQSIAFLAHIAESQDIWGPFLIIAPASTLHNWQQEFSRFLPKLKVLPYWGNTSDRKILRKFWNHKDLNTEGASFHVLITSYQLVVQDVKYFQRIKWQYMVLDEAQAIKSSSSVRWKILLGFNCRNRLLLTGTPIQNSMAELWALLHFIMPTLFDSHDEFNEWFSKEIEGHAENKNFIDEKHLSRLHMILKPFMLRRIKKDVENELSDKIEILLYCRLTTRQKRLYTGLKQKISIDDLLHSTAGGGNASAASQASSQSATSSLMNLVMQFRKVCNHPELFERREIRSPLIQKLPGYAMPKLIFRDGILSQSLPSRQRLLGGLLNIYQPENVNRSIFSDDGKGSTARCFSFLRFLGLSSAELLGVLLFGLLYRWLLICREMDRSFRIHHRHVWWEDSSVSRYFGPGSLLFDSVRSTSVPSIVSSPCLRALVFTSHASTVYAHGDVTMHCVPETREHRKMRAQKLVRIAGPQAPPPPPPQPLVKVASTHAILASVGPSHPKSPTLKSNLMLKSQQPNQLEETLAPEFKHRERPPQVLHCQPVEMPSFLTACCPKATATQRDLHCSDRSAAYWCVRYLHGGGLEGADVWHHGRPELAEEFRLRRRHFRSVSSGGIAGTRPQHGWSGLVIPDKETLVTDSGKLNVLDNLLGRLKPQGHRVLIYSQMTRMIDLLEEYMWHRKHTYMRLDGSSKISERRDMVADFQSRSDIFVFLLSTRAGGLGINLTAADTVVFYDSDWNPTVDQQAMDRAHRLGQTKQVTVYRLICKGTIEERIQQRAREKSEIQRMVISGGQFKPDTLKPKEVVSLLLDDDELESNFRQRQAEKRLLEDQFKDRNEKKRKRDSEKNRVGGVGIGSKKVRVEVNITIPATSQDSESIWSVDSVPPSPSPSEKSFGTIPQDDSSNEGSLIVDDGTPVVTSGVTGPSQSSAGTPANIIMETSSASLPTGSSSKRSGGGSSKSSNRSTGRSRGRPKGSCTKRSVGGRSQRPSGLGTAEVVGVQVGASAAAFAAAYGYGNSASMTTTATTTGASSGPSPIRVAQVTPVRGHGVRMRGPISQGPSRFPFKSTSTGELTNVAATGIAAAFSSVAHAKGMGFYVQNNPST